MTLRSPLPSPARGATPFCGRGLSDVLEQRTATAVAAVQRLNAWGEAGTTVQQIADAHDVLVPVPRWEAGSVHFAATADQRMTATWTWEIDGDAGALSLVPSRRLTSEAPFVSIVGSSLRASITERILTASRVDAVAAETTRWVERNLTNLAREVNAWRPTHRQRIEDALQARARLLDRIRELEAEA